jgi:hypothetical protein
MSHSHKEIFISATNTHILKAYLGKCSLKDLNNLVENSNGKESKEKKIVKFIESKFNAGITYAEFAQLEIQNLKNTTKGKTWNAYSLSYNLKSKNEKNEVLDNNTLNQTMSNELNSFYEHYTHSEVIDSANWIRISIDLQKNVLKDTDKVASKVLITSLIQTIYIVYYPRSDSVFIHGLTNQYKKVILSCLANVINCSQIEHSGLEGDHLESLKSMTLDRASQGRFKKFRVGDENGKNPLDRTNEIIVPLLKENPLLVNSFINITYENEKEIEKKEIYMKNEFEENVSGSTSLTKIEYATYIDYQIPKVINEDDIKEEDMIEIDANKNNDNNVVTMTVKFSGKNVISGIQECLKHNLIYAPLPTCLENLHSNSKNTFHWGK